MGSTSFEMLSEIVRPSSLIFSILWVLQERGGTWLQTDELMEGLSTQYTAWMGPSRSLTLSPDSS